MAVNIRACSLIYHHRGHYLIPAGFLQVPQNCSLPGHMGKQGHMSAAESFGSSWKCRLHSFTSVCCVCEHAEFTELLQVLTRWRLEKQQACVWSEVCSNYMGKLKKSLFKISYSSGGYSKC